MMLNYSSPFWFMDPNSAHMITGPMMLALQGKTPTNPKPELPKASMLCVSSGGAYIENNDMESATQSEQKYVAVIPIKGVIVKYSDYWVNGMDLVTDWINKAAKDPNISSIILDFDTPGGASTAIDLPMAAILSARAMKNVYAYVGNGMCASAGYALASQCTKIISSFPSDMVGSIGTYMTVHDFNKYFESMGMPVHEIYATLSTEKNLETREAVKGNPQPAIDLLIDPLNNHFINSVKAGRGDQLDEKVLHGGMYFPDDAMSFGLIDDVMTFAELVTLTIAEAKTETQNIESMFGTKFKSTTALMSCKPEERTPEMVLAAATEMEAVGIVGFGDTKIADDLSQLQTGINTVAEKLGIDAKDVSIETITSSVEDLQAITSGLEIELQNLKDLQVPPAGPKSDGKETPAGDSDFESQAAAMPHNQNADSFLG